MKTIVCVTPRGVETLTINPTLLAAMMGSGTGFGEVWKAREIEKRTTLVPRWSLAFATAWANGVNDGGLTEAEALDLIGQKDRPIDTTATIVVEDTSLPTFIRTGVPAAEWYFRDAAEWTSAGCVCNMPKARLIHMTHIRTARDKALAALDVPFMRAVETGNLLEQQRIGGEKQVLRDIPQNFSLAGFTTPETLKAAWPDQLPPREPL